MKLNLPNQLIIVRFFLALLVIILLGVIPYSLENNFFTFTINNIVVSWFNFIALLVFLLAAFTDFLDGYLARKKNDVTNFGKFFDPLADKILVNSVLVFFAVYLYIPVFVVVLFIIRDLMVDGLRMSVASNGKVLSANKIGKFKTFFQVIGISILFIFHPDNINTIWFDYSSLEHLYLIPLYLGLFFSLYSGFIYYKNNYKEII